jgi:hypothetical protein
MRLSTFLEKNSVIKPNQIANYIEYLEDKRVIIVGPAPTIEGRNWGKIIDSYDVVVRINNAVASIKGKEKDYGFRTDINYINRWFYFHKLNTIKDIKSIKYLVTLKNTKRSIDKRVLETIIRIPGFNMGVVTILDLLKYNIKSLDVCGFSFYSKDISYYTDNYQLTSLAFSSHRTAATQIQFLLLKQQNDDRLKFLEDCEKYLKVDGEYEVTNFRYLLAKDIISKNTNAVSLKRALSKEYCDANPLNLMKKEILEIEKADYSPELKFKDDDNKIEKLKSNHVKKYGYN